jgi:hypothetical protein
MRRRDRRRLEHVRLLVGTLDDGSVARAEERTAVGSRGISSTGGSGR